MLDLFHVTKVGYEAEKGVIAVCHGLTGTYKSCGNSSEGVTRDSSHQLQLGMFKLDIREIIFSRRQMYWSRFTRWVEESPDLDVFKTLPGKAMAFL